MSPDTANTPQNAEPAAVHKGASTPFEDIVVAVDGPVMTIRINRPHLRNACRIQTLNEMCAALDQATDDPDIRAIIICGTGPQAFSSGADLKEFKALSPAMSVDQRMSGWRALLDTMKAMRKPVISAVRGYAVGGGTEIALSSHIVLASQTALFGLPEILRGHIPGAAGTVFLPRRIGTGLGLYYLLTGEHISAEVALRAGLAAKVFADERLDEEARTLALHLSNQSPVVLAALIEAVIAGRDMTSDEALALERRLCVQVRDSKDFWEGLEAFVDKRAPVYGQDAIGSGRRGE